MAPLRVLIIAQRFPPHVQHGAERQAATLARALADLGVDVRVQTTRSLRAQRAPDQVLGIQVARMPTLPPPLMKPSQAIGGVLACLAGRGVDVVHAHSLSSTTLGAIVGAAVARLPILVKQSLGGPHGDAAALAASPAAALARRIVRSASAFAVLDDSIAEELALMGVPRSHMHSVDNGVDVALHRPAEDAERAALRRACALPAGPLAVFVGQLEARKGVPELLEAFERVRSQRPDAHLAIVGGGSLAADVASAAARLPGLLALGPRSDVADLLRAADVFVLPSRFEGFANAVLEAMACGLPVVVTRAVVPPRVGLDDAVGAVVEPTAAAIAAGITAMLASADLRRACGQRARKLALQFRIERVAQDHVTLYRQLMAERAAGAGGASPRASPPAPPNGAFERQGGAEVAV